MNNYQDIKTLDALNAAIEQSGKTLAVKEKQLKRRFDKARAFYTPSALVAEGGRSLFSRLPFTEIAFFLVRKIRKLF